MTLNELSQIKEELNKSKVIGFPTETVMGLGVLFDDEKAYKTLNIIKRRPEDKPYTMMLGNIKEIEKYADLSVRDKIIINAFMPGPLTILVNAKKCVPSYVTHGTGIIGIRVPKHCEVCEMINYVGKPLLVPSANRSGEKPATTFKEVESIFGDELGFIVKMDSNKDKPSTIIDLTGSEIKIIREGSISLNEIYRRLKEMKIAVGCDHGGLEYKNEVATYLKNKGYEIIDVGTYSKDSCHYPIFGAEAARKVANGEADFGIVICTSGEGIMMSANKIDGVRCGLGYNDDVSALMRQHNDANMIAFGQKFMTLEDVIRRVDIFLNTNFEGGRHLTRVEIIKSLEK